MTSIQQPCRLLPTTALLALAALGGCGTQTSTPASTQTSTAAATTSSPSATSSAPTSVTSTNAAGATATSTTSVPATSATASATGSTGSTATSSAAAAPTTTSVPVPTAQAPGAATSSAIAVSSPAAGSVVPAGHVVAAGDASVFEANLVWQLLKDGAGLRRGIVTASAPAPGRGSFSVDLGALPAGSYTLTLTGEDPSGRTSGPRVSRSFTVR